MDAEPVKVLSRSDGRGRGRQRRRRPGGGPELNGRGLAAADYDNDGDLDFAVDSIGGPLVLLRNSGAEGHWLEVELGSFAPGREGDGGAPRRAAARAGGQAGASYLSSEDPRVHFGLGAATQLRALVVRYPSGREARLRSKLRRRPRRSGRLYETQPCRAALLAPGASQSPRSSCLRAPRPCLERPSPRRATFANLPATPGRTSPSGARGNGRRRPRRRAPARRPTRS